MKENEECVVIRMQLFTPFNYWLSCNLCNKASLFVQVYSLLKKMKQGVKVVKSIKKKTYIFRQIRHAFKNFSKEDIILKEVADNASLHHHPTLSLSGDGEKLSLQSHHSPGSVNQFLADGKSHEVTRNYFSLILLF